MNDPYDNRKMSAFLDDITRVCIKHGMYISTSQAEDRYELPEVLPLFRGFEGYSSLSSSGLKFFMSMPSQFGRNESIDARSEDVSSMSAHERLAWAAAQRRECGA